MPHGGNTANVVVIGSRTRRIHTVGISPNGARANIEILNPPGRADDSASSSILLMAQYRTVPGDGQRGSSYFLIGVDLFPLLLHIKLYESLDSYPNQPGQDLLPGQ